MRKEMGHGRVPLVIYHIPQSAYHWFTFATSQLVYLGQGSETYESIPKHIAAFVNRPNISKEERQYWHQKLFEKSVNLEQEYGENNLVFSGKKQEVEPSFTQSTLELLVNKERELIQEEEHLIQECRRMEHMSLEEFTRLHQPRIIPQKQFFQCSVGVSWEELNKVVGVALCLFDGLGRSLYLPLKGTSRSQDIDRIKDLNTAIMVLNHVHKLVPDLSRKEAADYLTQLSDREYEQAIQHALLNQVKLIEKK